MEPATDRQVEDAKAWANRGTRDPALLGVLGTVLQLCERIRVEQARADNALTDTEAAELTARIRIEVQRADAAEAKSARLEAALWEVYDNVQLGARLDLIARNALSGQEG
jgi:hypothetical protein